MPIAQVGLFSSSTRLPPTASVRICGATHSGVVIHDESRAFQGYTLYTSGDGPHARLVSMDGKVVHQWQRPFSTIWDKDRAAVKRPQPDDLIYMRKARMFPNGDLLAIYIAAGDTPWGYGMVKINKNSETIWSYLEQTHHDFDIAPDGRIFALTHEFIWGGTGELRAPGQALPR